VIISHEFPSDYTFYYKLDDKNLYQIMCILISRSLIVQFLNKKMYGIEARESLTLQQRNNLDFIEEIFIYWRQNK
jgi:hypothetical protein